MIHLNKLPKPQILIEKENEWTQEYLAALNSANNVSNTIRFRYRHREVKDTLKKEAHDKCIYCEDNVTIGETDHILPVSEKPELIVSWENLGLTCKDCNMNKGEYYDENEPLINPFVDEPNDHLVFYGPLVAHQVGDLKGLRTIEQIQLTRTSLFEKRKERIDKIISMIEQWNSIPDGSTKNIIKKKILDESSKDKAFSATIKQFIYQRMNWLQEDI